MTTICGVCRSEPPKYRCPSCDLRYCSLVCYKEHIVEHAEESAKGIQPATQPALEAAASKPTVLRTQIGSRKVDFTGLENNPQLLELLKKHDALRVQLQSVYGFTLEPAPEDRRSRGGFRGRGRGRGARGGRGGRDSFNPLQQSGPWTQAKGDKEAQGQLKRLREAEEEGGVAEFVRLVKMMHGKGAVAEQN